MRPSPLLNEQVQATKSLIPNHIENVTIEVAGFESLESRADSLMKLEELVCMNYIHAFIHISLSPFPLLFSMPPPNSSIFFIDVCPA